MVDKNVYIYLFNYEVFKYGMLHYILYVYHENLINK